MDADGKEMPYKLSNAALELLDERELVAHRVT